MRTPNLWIKSYDRQLVDECIESRAPGEYTLPELIGDTWDWVLRKTVWGRFVKKDVTKTGRFPRLRWVRQRSDKKQIYELLAA